MRRGLPGNGCALPGDIGYGKSYTVTTGTRSASEHINS